MLFIISGYIFAMQDHQPHGERVKKRFITLMIPYFIWSAVGLLITYLWQQFPITAEVLQNAKLDQLGDNRPYREIGWQGVLFRWIVVPISFQLWFILSLFFYNLLYPFFKWVVTKYPVIWFSVNTVLVFIIFQFFVLEAQGMLFFSLGIWLNKRNYPIERKPRWFSSYLSWLFFLGLAVIKTFMAFEFETYTVVTVLVMTILHFSSVIAGIVAVWYSLDRVVKWCMNRKWFLWLSSFSFIIYGLHIPLLAYLTSLVYMYFHNIPNYRLLTYIVVPVIIFFFCIGVGALLRKWLPGFYRLATGGRGI
jgi:fucose 4-O-acetylase-like acetyltransferase